MKNVNTSLIKRTSRCMANLKTNVATYRPGRGGFTLVELLVVVLIIGILSSVALPQYTKAVNKSKVAGYWPTLKNLAEAAKLCKLEKGSPCNLNELDIEAPVCKELSAVGSCSYFIGASGETVGVNFGGGSLGLGVGSGGRYCGSNTDSSMCAKYGMTGTSVGANDAIHGISMQYNYALDSTSN